MAPTQKSAVTTGTYNVSNLRNEWEKFKQYTLDEDFHVVSIIPLREYLNKFLDSLSNTPLEPTEIEKANTVLACIDSLRALQVAIFDFGLQLTNPTYNDVKA